MSWDAFLASFRWAQGEHVSLVGPTGTGKTTLGLDLLHRRALASPKWHATILATKPKDATMDTMRRKGWRVTRSWPPPTGSRSVILWPPWRDVRDMERQRAAAADAFAAMFGQGSWCLFVDELSYIVRELHLENWLRSWWQQGRSLNLTLMGATQRPAWVPLDLYSQATHLFLWRTNDETDLRRIAGVGSFASTTIRDAVATLERHEVLYVNTRTSELARTRVERTPIP